MTKKFINGFSLVEIMIIIVIIGVILAIALPNYFKSSKTSQKTICMANLEKIDAAIDQWVLENHVSTGTDISGSWEEIYAAYLRGGEPRCPAGGAYILYAVGARPQVGCSKDGEGHKLP